MVVDVHILEDEKIVENFSMRLMVCLIDCSDGQRELSPWRKTT